MGSRCCCAIAARAASTFAAADSTHLTTIGMAQNESGTGFDNQPGATTDILLKYTYASDATLDGMVDGSDYSRIDNEYITHTAGWANGDFNYDGQIDGSDYTLIDNAFNSQVASPASAISAAEIAPKSPASRPLFKAFGSFNVAAPIPFAPAQFGPTRF